MHLLGTAYLLLVLWEHCVIITNDNVIIITASPSSCSCGRGWWWSATFLCLGSFGSVATFAGLLAATRCSLSGLATLFGSLHKNQKSTPCIRNPPSMRLQLVRHTTILIRANTLSSMWLKYNNTTNKPQKGKSEKKRHDGPERVHLCVPIWSVFPFVAIGQQQLIAQHFEHPRLKREKKRILGARCVF
jgi:hypothetical protein